MLARQPRFQRRAFKPGLAIANRGGDAFTQRVDHRAFACALLGGHAAKRLEQTRDRSLLAEKFDPQHL